MIILYIICAVILLAVLFLMQRARIVLNYSDTLSITAGVLFINIKLVPQKEEKLKFEKIDNNKKTVKKSKKKKEKQSPLSEFTEDIDTQTLLVLLKKYASKLISLFSKHLYITFDRFHLSVATGDPAATGILYGVVSQSCSYFFELIDKNTRLNPLSKSDIKVTADFNSFETKADLKIIIHLRIIHILKFIISAFFDLIKAKEKNNNKIKLKGNDKNE